MSLPDRDLSVVCDRSCLSDKLFFVPLPFLSPLLSPSPFIDYLTITIHSQPHRYPPPIKLIDFLVVVALGSDHAPHFHGSADYR